MNTNTSPAIVMMFSGLGSETFQMGRDLFATNQTFQSSILELDQVARRCAGHSVLKLLYSESLDHPPKQELVDTCLAVYMLQLAMARTLKAYGIEPDCTLAVSMGFFAAATVAGCMEPEEAMRAIMVQARAIEVHCPRGGMLAVLAPANVARDPNVACCCEIAAINSASHFVLSADAKGLDTVEAYLRRSGIICQRLPVEYGFHSRWIDGARLPLENLLAAMAGRRGRIPIICCARAERMQQLSAECFWKIAREPIRFHETIMSLERTENLYIDAGPAGSLATALKGALRPNSRSLVMSTLTPFHNDLQNLEALLAFRRSVQQDMAPKPWTNRAIV